MSTISLSCLPRRVIMTLFELEPSLIHLFLVALGSKSLHVLSREVVYQSITLDDGLAPGPPSQLATILNGPESYRLAVRHLRVVSPSGPPTVAGEQSDDGRLSPSASSESSGPLAADWDGETLAALLRRLPGLRTFCWAADRVPMDGLCMLIGQHCPNLEAFTLDIPSRVQPSRPPGRRRAHTNGWVDDPDSDGELPGAATLRPLRWDADAIEGLPPSLTRLALSSLSATGGKNVSKAFETLTWSGLLQLRLSKSLFIDDELMASIVLGSKKIKSLMIESMGGTKLTERGIEHLFNGLDGLEEIELFDVEGRFSKNGWLKFEDLPTSLKSIKFGYHETGSYHSWTLDHLQSIFSLLSLYPNQLERLSIARNVPLPALLPGRHAMYPELAISPRTAAKKISKEQILTIVEEGKSLKELNIDWWLISVEGLEAIVKGLPNLVKLTVLVDAPFHRIIASTAFVHSRIRTLTVSIPPEHTPLVQEMVRAPMTPLPKTPSTTPMSPTTVQSSPALSPGGLPSLGSPVPTRDLKKFVKRAGHLKEIVWTGRGGLGMWRFSRNSGSAVNVKVEFVPVVETLPAEALGYVQQTRGGSSPQQTHRRAGSSSRQSPSCGQSGARQGVRVGSGGRARRRPSSVAAHDEAGGNENVDCSRRSSSGSLATSWSSGCHYLSGGGLRGGLEGIPGTPAGETEEELECKKVFAGQDDALVEELVGQNGVQERLFGLLRDEEFRSSRFVN